MATTAVCVCHTRKKKTSEKLLKFSDRSWQTYVRCAKFWKECESGRFSLLARKTEPIWSKSIEDSGYENFRYHRTCYQDFTNKATIEGATKRRRLTDELKICAAAGAITFVLFIQQSGQ
ncbi:hypothetical protein HOLleu_42090 [Holothuria leucospilota]|uniref:Uncharacterized protein n=1 Tax=Holothuria leucospilota TaxID=206669 RepID=A0A9Q0YCZ6_HOLLE|nr:hypothetical protein HOLleu_42090 [Holothuria leucospilota]